MTAFLIFYCVFGIFETREVHHMKKKTCLELGKYNHNGGLYLQGGGINQIK